MNKLFGYITVIVLSLIAVGCDDEDNTGDSTLIKSNPTISIDVPNPAVSFIEKDSTLQYTVTLSTPQIVDVAVYLNVVDGDATEGDDFSTESVIIPAGRTSGQVSVKILADDVPEGTETFTVQIGDDRTANASIAPKTVAFTIMNVSKGDLPLTLSWATNYYDATGELIPPTDVSDMIFYVTELNGVGRDTVDGTGFESFIMEQSYPDGTYLLKAGVANTLDPGDLGSPAILDLSLDFFQVGKIEETTLVFPKAFDTKLICDGNIFTLAKVVKAGANYTVTIVSEAASVDVSAFVGAYDCDEPGYKVYPVNFTLGDQPGVIVNDNFWDAGAEIEYVLDVCGTVTIPLQSFAAGATYTVTGSGTYDPATEEMVVDYVVKNAAGTTVDANEHTFTRP